MLPVPARGTHTEQQVALFTVPVDHPQARFAGDPAAAAARRDGVPAGRQSRAEVRPGQRHQ